MNNKKLQKKSDKKLLWFKAKSFGWGWYPCTWQGWAILTAYTVVFATTLTIMMNSKIEDNNYWVIYICWSVALFTGLLWVCYKYGEKPSWRWGNKRK